MEKVIVAGKSDGSLDDDISENFGRCSSFCIVGIEGGEVVSVTSARNTSADYPRSAGTMAASWAVNIGISAVIAGRFGPGSTLVFHRAGVRQYELGGRLIQDAVDMLLDGSLECLDCSPILESMILQNRFRKGNRMDWTSLRRGDEHYICSDCGCMMPGKRIAGMDEKVCPNCGGRMK